VPGSNERLLKGGLDGDGDLKLTPAADPAPRLLPLARPRWPTGGGWVKALYIPRSARVATGTRHGGDEAGCRHTASCRSSHARTCSRRPRARGRHAVEWNGSHSCMPHTGGRSPDRRCLAEVPPDPACPRITDQLLVAGLAGPLALQQLGVSPRSEANKQATVQFRRPVKPHA